jgi:hypothetical protein
MIDVSVESSKVLRKLDRLKLGFKPDQLVGPMNKSTDSAKAHSRKLAGQVLNLTGKDFYQSASRKSRGDLIFVDKATRFDLRSRLVISGKLIPIHRFKGGVKEQGKGVVARTWKGLGYQYFHHGFIPQKGGPAFRRRHKSPSTRAQRLPIDVILGPSVSDALTPASDQIKRFWWKRYEIEYLRKVRGLLARG